MGQAEGSVEQGGLLSGVSERQGRGHSSIRGMWERQGLKGRSSKVGALVGGVGRASLGPLVTHPLS